MSPFLKQIILATGIGDWENTIWMQILILVILAASWGVYAFIKNKPENLKDNERDLEGSGSDYTKSSRLIGRQRTNLSQHKEKYPAQIKDIRVYTAQASKSTLVPLSNSSIANQQKAKNISPRKTTRDINSGMELLDLDLLLHIVHNTKGNDKNDVTMRKLAFNELLRRQNQNRINGTALTVYAVNKKDLYGKGIQCEAIKELAERTSPHKHKI